MAAKYPSVKIDPDRVLKEVMVELKHKPIPKKPINAAKIKASLEAKIRKELPLWLRPSFQTYEDKKESE